MPVVEYVGFEEMPNLRKELEGIDPVVSAPLFDLIVSDWKIIGIKNHQSKLTTDILHDSKQTLVSHRGKIVVIITDRTRHWSADLIDYNFANSVRIESGHAQISREFRQKLIKFIRSADLGLYRKRVATVIGGLSRSKIERLPKPVKEFYFKEVGNSYQIR